MKYTIEIEINQPREKVVDLLDDPDNLKRWQPGLISFETISGVRGQKGAISKIVQKMGKQEIEMIETVTERKGVEAYHAVYESKGVWNEVKNFFHEAGPGKTKWVTENEFRCKGFLMKLICLIFPGNFKKQSYQYMKNFKHFAESKIIDL